MSTYLERMRILHVLNSPKIGGTESWFLDFARAHDTDIESQLILFGSNGPLAEEMGPYLIASLNDGFPGRTRAVRLAKLATLARRNRPDQIWLHSDLARAYGSFRLTSASVPSIAVCHSPWGARHVDRRLRGLGRRRAWDGVVLVNERLAEELPRGTEDSGQVATLVPLPRVAVDGPEPGLRSGDRTLLYIARLVEGKGHELLLRAFAEVVQSAGDVKLVLVGDGPLLQQLQEVACGLHIDGQIEFVGSSTDIRRYLQAADVFVHPSESEGLSRSGLEAALFGLPIVARLLESHNAYLDDGVNGIYFRQGTASGLAATISDAFDRLPALRRGAATTAKRIKKERCSEFTAALDEVRGWECQ